MKAQPISISPSHYIDPIGIRIGFMTLHEYYDFSGDKTERALVFWTYLNKHNYNPVWFDQRLYIPAHRIPSADDLYRKIRYLGFADSTGEWARGLTYQHVEHAHHRHQFKFPYRLIGDYSDFCATNFGDEIDRIYTISASYNAKIAFARDEDASLFRLVFE